MAEAAATPKHGLKYYLKRSMLYLVVIYLALVLLLFIFQRKLIYFPGTLEDPAPTAFGWHIDQTRAVETKTADGISLRGWHVLPDVEKPDGGESAVIERKFDSFLESDGKPVVLFFHGNAGTRADRSDLYSKLSKLDTHVVAFDYRGYGGSSGYPTEQGLEQDANAAWKWLIETKNVNPNRIVIAGESLGCAVAVRLAQQQSKTGARPMGLVLEAPFSTLGDAAAAHYPFFPVRWILTDRYPSIDRIADVTCPILIFHGNEDEVVPYALGEKLFAKARETSDAGVAKRFVRVEGAEHNNIRLFGADLYRTEWQEFLKRLKLAQASK